jgi:hypothetical protein
MLKNVTEIEKSIKKRKKKQLESTWINLSNSLLESWDEDNLIESELK